jgi:hypothetical protein
MSSVLNETINEAHHQHYKDRPKTGLVDPEDSPNSNWIYHLYDDGEITHQKGGHAYGMRTEFQMRPPCIIMPTTYRYVFPLCGNDNRTYAILKEEECMFFRARMQLEI